MPELSSTKSFLHWMYATRFEDIPSDVRQMTLLALYDGIGCNLACSMLPSAHRMVDFANLNQIQGGNYMDSGIKTGLRVSEEFLGGFSFMYFSPWC